MSGKTKKVMIGLLLVPLGLIVLCAGVGLSIFPPHRSARLPELSVLHIQYVWFDRMFKGSRIPGAQGPSERSLLLANSFGRHQPRATSQKLIYHLNP